MAHITQTTEVLRPNTRISPERLAWGILWLTFALFCVFCVVTTLGVHFFFFQSTIPLNTMLQVSRGTAGILTRSDSIEEAVRSDPRTLSNGTSISTDAQTQASLLFYAAETTDQLLATVTIKRETELAFGSANQPRFEWSINNYYVDLYNFSGQIDVLITNTLQKDFRLDIYTVQGSWISLSQGGSYAVEATEDQVRVINRHGQATLFTPDARINRSIPETMQGVFLLGAAEIALSPAYVELLENSTFEALEPRLDTSGPDNQNRLPLAWVCANSAQDESPRGTYRSESRDGRLTMRLFRGEGASTHGETRCHQAFRGQTGLDMSQYDYLSLRATFYVNYQSLSVCGVDGSECPLMLKMDYVDVNGVAREWYHGFYAKIDPQYDYPFRCSSCTQDHERIYEKTWYTYESGNLFTLFPPDVRPRSVLLVRFYASGHQYDVYVGEVSLSAGHLANGLNTGGGTP